MWLILMGFSYHGNKPLGMFMMDLNDAEVR